MTVRELMNMLGELDPGMLVLETRCSDLGPMDVESWSVIEAVEIVKGPHGWHKWAWSADGTEIAPPRKCLHYGGN